MVGEGPAYDINGCFGSPKKKFCIILIKQTQNFAWVYILMIIIVICLLLEKRFIKADNKTVNFPTQFRRGSTSNRFGANESRKVSLKGNFNYSAIDRSEMFPFTSI